MDRNQVRARIVEAARAVKDQLGAQPVPAGGADDRAGAQRRGPFWVEERGFKYVDDVEAHLRRLFRSFDLLDPREGISVFEIGPGNCFLLFMCRELRGCRVAGVDWKLAEGDAAAAPEGKPFQELARYAHALFRRQFGLEDVVRHQIVEAYRPVAFDGRYDAVVATHTAFNHGWTADAYRSWLRDCHEHLLPDGRLMIALNKVEPDALAELPFLRPARPTPGFKKLTVLARDTIGRVLAAAPGEAGS